MVAEAELLQEDVNTMFKGVIAFGKIRELTEMKDKQRVFEMIIPQIVSGFYPERPGVCGREQSDAARVYEIEIEHITGKKGE